MDRIAIDREILIHKKLNHPHIIKMYNSFDDDKYRYIILEYMENGNIFGMIRQSPVPEEVTIQIMSQCMSALAYIHGLGILHRDIKPENILWDKKNNFKMSDFGFSAGYTETKGRKTMCGTTEYLAPEVINNMIQDDRLDIWCMGILLFELIHRRTPYDARNTYTLNKEIHSKKVECQPGTRKEFAQFIDLCLKANPRDRPSAQSLIDNFQIFQLNNKNNQNFSNPQQLQPKQPQPQSQQSFKKQPAQDVNNFKKKQITIDPFFNTNNNVNTNTNNGTRQYNAPQQYTPTTQKTEKAFSKNLVQMAQTPAQNNYSNNNSQPSSAREVRVISTGNQQRVFNHGIYDTSTPVSKPNNFNTMYSNGQKKDSSSSSSFLNHDEKAQNVVQKREVITLDDQSTRSNYMLNKYANYKNPNITSNYSTQTVQNEPFRPTPHQIEVNDSNMKNQILSLKKIIDVKPNVSNFVNIYSKTGYNGSTEHTNFKSQNDLIQEKNRTNLSNTIKVTKRIDSTGSFHGGDQSLNSTLTSSGNWQKQSLPHHQKFSLNKSLTSDNFFIDKNRVFANQPSNNFDISHQVQSTPTSYKVGISNEKSSRMLAYDTEREAKRNSQLQQYENERKRNDTSPDKKMSSRNGHSSYSLTKIYDPKNNISITSNYNKDNLKVNFVQEEQSKQNILSPQGQMVKRFI